jgi:molybdopterin-binding protein
MSIAAINVRNQFRGKVKEIIQGPVLSEIDVETPSGAIVTSVITTRSVKRAAAQGRQGRDRAGEGHGGLAGDLVIGLASKVGRLGGGLRMAALRSLDRMTQGQLGVESGISVAERLRQEAVIGAATRTQLHEIHKGGLARRMAHIQSTARNAASAFTVCVSPCLRRMSR